MALAVCGCGAQCALQRCQGAHSSPLSHSLCSLQHMDYLLFHTTHSTHLLVWPVRGLVRCAWCEYPFSHVNAPCAQTMGTVGASVSPAVSRLAVRPRLETMTRFLLSAALCLI